MRNFFVRRILRIWPLYLVFLFAMWWLGRAGVFYPIETPRLLAFLFFAGNVYSGVFGLTFNPILPLWTISIEEQFYILWPALARGGNRLLQRGAWAIVALSIASVALIPRFAANPSLALWTSSLVQFQFFALGALLALRFAHRLPRWTPTLRLALAAGGAMLLLAAAGPLHIGSGAPAAAIPLLVAGYETMALGIVLLFLAFLGAAEGRAIVPAPLAYLGKISYGLYVFHDLSLQLCLRLSRHLGLPTGFRAVGAAALTLALAMFSYRFFETPFLLLKDRFALVRTRPA
jgi:peptidoglycan/LPS O-acetylase OafA/YrhL